MTTSANSPRRPVALLILALLLLLGAGTIRTRQNYLTRGIPAGLPEPIEHGGARLGINVYLHGLDEAELDETLGSVAATGVQIVKQPFYFEAEGSFDWAASDIIVAAVDRHDLQLAVLLDGDPRQSFAPPANPQAFARWAAAFAQRYGTQVRAYFIWDEPNLSSHWGLQAVNPVEYAALLAATARAIRAADSDALVVAAALAPTTESGPQNLSDVSYLEEMYAAGAGPFFDAAAGKPYGFSKAPGDRTVDPDTLNFSRAILLREVMVRHGDDDKALFAGNWGWNALPPDWQGPPSIWGQVNGQTRVAYTADALERARREWPWMGLMFLEAWRAPGQQDDPRHGFDVVQSPLQNALAAMAADPDLALPGFHLATAFGPGQAYEGGWRFSEQFGADISETGDMATITFWGTEAGLRVRRADYRARFYVTIDGEPASALPHDGDGAALVLTAPDPLEDFVEIVPVARGLEAGPHIMRVEAYRGWDQWALHGFSIGYRPDMSRSRLSAALLLFMGGLIALAATRDFCRISWTHVFRKWRRQVEAINERGQLLLTLATALVVTLTGWLTWGEQAAGIYRRLGDSSQLALTAAAASMFYVAPSFLIYMPALLVLFVLLYARPAWGLALVALFFPFYVLPKPLGGYRFSPVELFVLVTAAAAAARGATGLQGQLYTVLGVRGGVSSALGAAWMAIKRRVRPADYAVAFFLVVATVSLLYTERLDVAQNEWRVVIFEPVLFYYLIRFIRPARKEMWTLIDAFVLSGMAVAVYGLWQYALGQNVITVAGGLTRLRSIYGSPNNVALYLGRLLPFLLALALMGEATPRRRILYAAALAPVGTALLLTFSKGGLFLGAPAGFGVVVLLWLRYRQRALWPWLGGAAIILLAAVVAIGTLPGLAARLDLQGTTSLLRLSLWQASFNMFADHPLFGVGLDNFLYAYRGRYILESGWEEPNLSHPHNIILDFATRLGVLGLVAGLWLIATLLRNLWRLRGALSPEWRPVAVAIAGSVAQMLAHGLVDHSFFLVDLAYTFFLTLGIAVWMQQSNIVTSDGCAG